MSRRVRCGLMRKEHGRPRQSMECGSRAAANGGSPRALVEQREPGSALHTGGERSRLASCRAGRRMLRPYTRKRADALSRPWLKFELGEFEEVAGAGVDFGALEFAEGLGGEIFYGKTAKKQAVNQCAAEGGVGRTAAACQIAHKD